MDGRLRGLHRILKEWRLLVALYSNNVYFDRSGGRDAAFWHLERSNIGILAAASWRSGCPALEEFTDEKGRPRSRASVDRRRPRAKGRIDLWMHLGFDDGVAFEAKQRLLSWRRTHDPRETIEDSIREAREEASRLSSDYAYRVGISFVIPKFDRRRYTSSRALRTAVSVFRHRAWELRGKSLWAWAPVSESLELDSIPFYENSLFPGVLLVGRVVGARRSSRRPKSGR